MIYIFISDFKKRNLYLLKEYYMDKMEYYKIKNYKSAY